MHGNAIGSSKNNQGTEGGGDLHLRTRYDICLLRSTCDCVSTFSCVREPDQHLRYTALNCCKQEHLRAQMNERVLFGKLKDPDWIVLKFRGQLQCRMGGGEREDHIEDFPKFWT